MAESQLDLLAPHAPDERFVIRSSSRARHMAISVGAHGVVEVVVPRHTRPEAVEQFVSHHRQWINRALGELASDRPHVDRSMPERIDLVALDECWTVRYGARRLASRDRCIEVPAARTDRPRCRESLHAWLKNQARETLVPRLDEFAARHGFRYKRVQVRGQRTRWGSFSSSGTLSLNFCLLFLEPELVEHLLLHELCHTREMSHGPQFWRLLESCRPGARERERRLDKAWLDVPAWVGLH